MKRIKVTNWLQQRKLGIGGSDAAVVCGLSKWKSPVSLFLEKTGGQVKEIDNNFTHWGKNPMSLS